MNLKPILNLSPSNTERKFCKHSENSDNLKDIQLTESKLSKDKIQGCSHFFSKMIYLQ